jgi:hypothetical protein
MSIYTKLANIQKDLFVPKGNRNDFGKYNYRSCEDILKVVKPLCEEQGCVLFITNNLVDIGNRIYVEAVVRLVDCESGETIESKAHAREEETKKGMDGSQITGSSSSYARKYALAGLFSIDNEKDSDATNTHGKDAENTKSAEEFDQKKYNEAVELAKMKSRILKYINDNGKDFGEVFANYKITDPSQLTTKICLGYIKYITEQGDAI